MSRMMIPLT